MSDRIKKDYSKKFGVRLRTAILREHPTLAAFSREAGLRDSQLNEWLTGSRHPRLESFSRLAKYLPKSRLEWLIWGTTRKQASPQHSNCVSE